MSTASIKLDDAAQKKAYSSLRILLYNYLEAFRGSY